MGSWEDMRFTAYQRAEATQSINPQYKNRWQNSVRIKLTSPALQIRHTHIAACGKRVFRINSMHMWDAREEVWRANYTASIHSTAGDDEQSGQGWWWAEEDDEWMGRLAVFPALDGPDLINHIQPVLLRMGVLRYATAARHHNLDDTRALAVALGAHSCAPALKRHGNSRAGKGSPVTAGILGWVQ